MSAALGGRALVAGIGNIFFGDDGFGPAVASLLQGEALPAEADVRDYGIRGVHLAYELLDAKYACLVLVDALPMGEVPGTLAVLEVDKPEQFGGNLDAHSMSPAVVLGALTALGGALPRVLVVGCQPAALDTGMTLSAPVKEALAPAVTLVVEVVRAELSTLARRPLVGAVDAVEV